MRTLLSLLLIFAGQRVFSAQPFSKCEWLLLGTHASQSKTTLAAAASVLSMLTFDHALVVSARNNHSFAKKDLEQTIHLSAAYLFPPPLKKWYSSDPNESYYLNFSRGHQALTANDSFFARTRELFAQSLPKESERLSWIFDRLTALQVVWQAMANPINHWERPGGDPALRFSVEIDRASHTYFSARDIILLPRAEWMQFGPLAQALQNSEVRRLTAEFICIFWPEIVKVREDALRGYNSAKDFDDARVDLNAVSPEREMLRVQIRKLREGRTLDIPNGRGQTPHLSSALARFNPIEEMYLQRARTFIDANLPPVNTTSADSSTIYDDFKPIREAQEIHSSFITRLPPLPNGKVLLANWSKLGENWNAEWFKSYIGDLQNQAHLQIQQLERVIPLMEKIQSKAHARVTELRTALNGFAKRTPATAQSLEDLTLHELTMQQSLEQVKARRASLQIWISTLDKMSLGVHTYERNSSAGDPAELAKLATLIQEAIDELIHLTERPAGQG